MFQGPFRNKDYGGLTVQEEYRWDEDGRPMRSRRLDDPSQAP